MNERGKGFLDICCGILLAIYILKACGTTIPIRIVTREDLRTERSNITMQKTETYDGYE